MKELGKIFLYLIATVVLGALLAYPLYLGANFLADQGILTWLGNLEFRKFFHRGVLLSAVLLIWPTVKWLHLQRPYTFGLQPNPLRKQDWLVGFLGSFLAMALLAGVLIVMEVYRVRGEIQWAGLGKVAVSSVTVSLLEEGLFRGFLLGLALQALGGYQKAAAGGRYLALFGVSALYSIVHFLKPPAHPTGNVGLNWLSGFGEVARSFEPFAEWQLVLGGFTTLFLVGWILGWTRLRTGSLWMAIGLHTGWILGKMGLGKIARRRKEFNDLLPWLGDDITIGIVSVVMVALTGVFIWLWITRWRKAPTASHEASPANG